MLISASSHSLTAPIRASRPGNYATGGPSATLETREQLSSQEPMASIEPTNMGDLLGDRAGDTRQNGPKGRSETVRDASSPSRNPATSISLEEVSSKGNHDGDQGCQTVSSACNGAASPDAAESERRMSLTRPWLGSRTSSSTIDIPIESIAQRTDQSPIIREERAPSTTSYFPDVEELQRAGVLEQQEQTAGLVDASKSFENKRDQRIDQRLPDCIPQSESLADADAKSQSRTRAEITPDVADPSRQSSTISTESWPCSKKHGDTPFGMSRVMALANSLCLDQSRIGTDARRHDAASVPRTSPGRTGLANLQPPLSSAVDDSISPKSQLPPVIGPSKQSSLTVRNRHSTPSFERQSSSGVSPMGKQASLTVSTPRSTEDALLESWGFTVSTPLCPPKCYPLSSPAINSAPKERFCRAGGSTSSVSSCSSIVGPRSAPPASETRRRFSSSTPPSAVTAGHRPASGTAGLNDNMSLGTTPGSAIELRSANVPGRAASPLRGHTSSFRSSRPSSLRLDSDHGSDGAGSDAVSSQSHTRESSRHNSEASSDYFAATTDWRRDSVATEHSSRTRASQSSGVFSMEDREQDEGMLSPLADAVQTPEDQTAHREAFVISAGQDQLKLEDHSDEPHIVPYEGVVNIIPYEDRYVISAIMEGFTIDNITVAVKSVKNGIREGIMDDTCSTNSAGSSVSSRSSFTAGNKTRKTKCVHLVADRWEDGGESA